MRAMDGNCGLWQDLNTGVQPAADKKFYLRLTIDKMHVFVDFTDKYLQSYGYSATNFRFAINCSNPNAEVQSKIIEIDIIETEI